jgi:hypothetical protein
MLATVEIPGFAAAIRSESDARRRAFLPVRDSIAGVAVRPLTLRDMLWLEEMQNGFFCPWRFDSDDEVTAHCAQLVWWLSDCPKPPADVRGIGFRYLGQLRRRNALIAALSRDPRKLVTETMDYLRAQFLDAPKGSGTNYAAPHFAGPVAITDLMAAAGYAFTTAQLFDMPLPQLWQFCRAARSRLFGEPLTNPSDKIACDFLAAQAPQGAH